MTGKLWQHYSITTEVMARFQQGGVLELSELEQTMATGVDADGKAAREEKMLQGLEAVLQQSSMTLANKLRLVAMFIIAQEGVTEEVRRQLVAAAGLTNEDQEALIHLEALGVSVQRAKGGGSGGGKGCVRACVPVCVSKGVRAEGAVVSSIGWMGTDGGRTSFINLPLPQSTSRLWGGKGKKAKRKADAASEYAASRYVCALKDLVDQAAQGELSADAYPSVLPMPTRYVKEYGDGGGWGGDGGLLGWLAGWLIICPWLSLLLWYKPREDKPVARSLRKPDKGRLGKQPATYTGGASRCSFTPLTLEHTPATPLTHDDPPILPHPHPDCTCLHTARTIVFVAGGVAFSEMRAAYEVMESQKKEVIIGGTSYLKPNDYVEQLRAIKG